MRAPIWQLLCCLPLSLSISLIPYSPCFGPQAGNPGTAPEAVYNSIRGVGLGLRQEWVPILALSEGS